MVEPKLLIDRRLDRIELAISMLAEELDMPQVGKVLAGEELEGASEEPAIGGGTHYPAETPEDERDL